MLIATKSLKTHLALAASGLGRKAQARHGMRHLDSKHSRSCQRDFNISNLPVDRVFKPCLVGV